MNKTEAIKKALKAGYYACAAFIAAVSLLLIATSVPIPGNFKALSVLSGSMEPSIHTGSVVVIKPAAEYKIGDVITFGKISKTRVPTTHRIVGINIDNGRAVYTTKGDANNAADTREVLKSEIAGKELFTVPYLGFALDFVKKPLGFLIVVILPAVLIVSDELRKIWAELAKKQPA